MFLVVFTAGTILNLVQKGTSRKSLEIAGLKAINIFVVCYKHYIINIIDVCTVL